MMRLPLVLLMLTVVSACLPAQVPLKEYDRFKNDPSFKAYIDGVGTGLLAANAELQTRKSALLYCPPAKLSLTVDMYMSILEKRVRERESQVPASTPVEFLLFMGFRRHSHAHRNDAEGRMSARHRVAFAVAKVGSRISPAPEMD